jgi:hypothetical protein
MRTRQIVGGGNHPGPRKAALLRGRAVTRGPRSVAAFWTRAPPGLEPSAPTTTGERGELRRGIRATIQGARILHSVPRPTLPGPPVRAVARRRRGGWLGFISSFVKPSRVKTGSGWLSQSAWFAVRWPPPSRGRSHHGHKTRRGLRPSSRCEDGRPQFWLVRRSFTGCRSR